MKNLKVTWIYEFENRGFVISCFECQFHLGSQNYNKIWEKQPNVNQKYAQEAVSTETSNCVTSVLL
jgi:hypothetical protein